MSIELYSSVLGSAGRQKLRAKALLAAGDRQSRLDAAILLHEAARTEDRALSAVETPDARLRLASLVEQCACLVEGLDPAGAATTWGRVLVASAEVPSPQRDAVRERLDPMFGAAFKAFRAELRTWKTIRRTGRLLPDSGVDRKTARRELEGTMGVFPGVSSLWYGVFRHDSAEERWKAAWKAIETARRLEPDNSRYAAMALWIAGKAIGEGGLDRCLAGISVETSGPEVLAMYALNQVSLAATAPASARGGRLAKALAAAIRGESLAHEAEYLRGYLVATRLLAQSLCQGDEPGHELLFQAGLGRQMVSRGEVPANDPVEFVLENVASSIGRSEELRV